MGAAARCSPPSLSPECSTLSSSRSWRSSLHSAGVALTLLLAARAVAAQPANSCVSCHATLADGRLSAPPAAFAQQDVHRESGFSCIDCHGGNRTAADKLVAHDAGRGFKGKPAGQAVIATCARCHGDAELMRKYAPRQRIDQATEY